MDKQKERGKNAHEILDLTEQSGFKQLTESLSPTTFLGYGDQLSTATVLGLLINGEMVEEADSGDRVQIILDRTPFYGESGGQIGDRGYLSGTELLVKVEDVQKESGFFIHISQVERGNLRVGDQVTAQIDRTCRRRVQANHTATHLLQAALKKVIGEDISQAGSLVSFDRLRFDFNCNRPLTNAEITTVEDLVNTWIMEGHGAKVEVMPIAQAKEKGAIAMFGEKYGSEVRVVDFTGVSMELCGGTHVDNTAEIGAFKIIAEAGSTH
jgi:alanyl-tRNA synthetase